MALANKYRPKSFSEVIGQDNAVLALRNIIKNKNFHNGYIFSGTRGVGKTSLGRLFAKALNCSNYDEENETHVVSVQIALKYKKTLILT